jgi:hypothetical protein
MTKALDKNTEMCEEEASAFLGCHPFTFLHKKAIVLLAASTRHQNATKLL